MRNYSFTPCEFRKAQRILRVMVFSLLAFAATALLHGPVWFAALMFLQTQVIGVFGLVWATLLLIRREREQNEAKD